MVSAWLRALREKSSCLDGPELAENDGWPGSPRVTPTGFQPEFPPRPRSRDPESCPGVSTRVSLSASRWGPDVLLRVPTQVLPWLRGGGPASCPGVPQGRDPTSCSGSRPISPFGVGVGGDPASYPGVPTRVPHLDRGLGTWRFVLLLRGVQGVRTQPVVPWASEGGQDGFQRAVRLKGRRGRG